jgi:predicted MFS family arabinose efflux permease
MLVIGDLAWLVIIPAALLVREPPSGAPAGGADLTAGADGPELTAAQAFRSPQFAAIAFTYFACCAAHSGPIFHMVANAIDHGVPAMAAATVLSAAGVASLTGKIVCGLVADRVGAKRVLVAGLALQAVAISLYLVTQQLAHFYGVSLMFGFAYGGIMPLYAIVVREYFGARIMGTIFGAVGFASTLGMALGPLAGGWVYDAFGGYAWLFAPARDRAAGAERGPLRPATAHEITPAQSRGLPPVARRLLSSQSIASAPSSDVRGVATVSGRRGATGLEAVDPAVSEGLGAVGAFASAASA